MLLRIVTLAFAVLVLQASSAWTQPLRILFDQANPPFMYAADNKAVGIYPAIIAEAFARMGQPVTLEALPWKRALISMDDGHAGVAGIYKTEERLHKYDYSDSLFEETLLVVTRAGSGLKYEGIESLRGKMLGISRGWTYGDEFEAARKAGVFQVEEADGDGQNLEKLRAQRIDVILCVREAAFSAMAGTGSRDKFTIQEKPFSVTPAFLAFSRQEHMEQTLAEFNAALRSMREDGTWDNIVTSILGK